MAKALNDVHILDIDEALATIPKPQEITERDSRI